MITTGADTNLKNKVVSRTKSVIYAMKGRMTKFNKKSVIKCQSDSPLLQHKSELRKIYS